MINITPPPELYKQWEHQPRSVAFEAAYRAGADMELEACLLWVGDGRRENLAKIIELRDHRRPKPPSLKEQALEALGPEPLPEFNPTEEAYLNRGAIERHRILRRALEALDD